MLKLACILKQDQVTQVHLHLLAQVLRIGLDYSRMVVRGQLVYWRR